MCFFKDELTVYMYFIFNSLQKYTKKPKVGCRPFIVPVFEMKVLRKTEKKVLLNALHFMIYFFANCIDQNYSGSRNGTTE